MIETAIVPSSAEQFAITTFNILN